MAPEQLWRLPDGWGVLKLGDSVSMKTGFACAKQNLVAEGLAHLRPFNISTGGELNLTEVYHVPERFAGSVDDYALQPGHVLFNNTNSVELVGKTAIVRQPLRCAFSNHITRLTVRQETRLDAQWLALSLRQLWAMGFFASHCNKWIGQAGINGTMLAEVKIPVPFPDDPPRSLAEQRRIVARVEALLAEVSEAQGLVCRIRQSFDKLGQSILAQAIRGEL